MAATPAQTSAEQPERRDAAHWFEQHFSQAADELIAFLAGDGITLEGKMVADIGSGDGIIDLALATKGSPKELVGYDIRQTDESALLRSAQVAGVVEELPANLSFHASEPDHIPAIPEAFDIVVSWSVFEHVSDPVALLGEVRRIIKPDGLLFMQIWPLFHSEHGGHLWPHFDESFPHLLHTDTAILDEISDRPGTYPNTAATDEYRSLNRISLDDLQRALLTNRLVITKLRLLTDTVHIPPSLSYLPLSKLGVGGVQLLAVPR